MVAYRAIWPSGCKRIITLYTYSWHDKPGPKDPQSSYSLLELFPMASINSLWHSITLLPQWKAILMEACSSTRVNSILHDTHQLTYFTALPALQPAITEPSVALHTYHACRTSTRHIYVCDPFTYLLEKNSCHDLCPKPLYDDSKMHNFHFSFAKVVVIFPSNLLIPKTLFKKMKYIVIGFIIKKAIFEHRTNNLLVIIFPPNFLCNHFIIDK